jgi:hypothetical protein
MNLKIKNIYENLITEAQSEACVRDFGKKLFDDQMGGSEPNTRKENGILNMLQDFSDNEYGAKMNPQFLRSLSELKNCLTTYPSVLMPNGVVYRGSNIPLSTLIGMTKSGGISTTGEFIYSYKPKSPVQSWTEKITVAKKFADKAKKDLNLAVLSPFKVEYPKLKGIDQKKFMQAISDKLDTVKVPVIISHVASPSSFLFNGKSFNRLSRYGMDTGGGFEDFDDDFGFDIPTAEIPKGEPEYEVLGINDKAFDVHGKLDVEIMRFIAEFLKFVK